MARVRVVWAMPPAARAMLVKVRSPDPMARSTSLLIAWGGNSAASERSAETSRAEIGLSSESRRNSQTSAPAGHSAQIRGSLP